jgi:hypothetical protein
MIKHYFKVLLTSFFGSLVLIVSFFFLSMDKINGVDSDFYRGDVLLVIYLFATHTILSALLTIYFTIKVKYLRPYIYTLIILPHFLFICAIGYTIKNNGLMVGGVQILVNVGLCLYSLWKIPQLD